MVEAERGSWCRTGEAINEAGIDGEAINETGIAGEAINDAGVARCGEQKRQQLQCDWDEAHKVPTSDRPAAPERP